MRNPIQLLSGVRDIMYQRLFCLYLLVSKTIIIYCEDLLNGLSVSLHVLMRVSCG